MNLGTRVRAIGRLSPVLPPPGYYQRTVLTTPTYDASGQATHPSVLKLHWRGWAYWMAMTPFTDHDENAERPSLLVSNDGTTWQAPAGLTNPVVDVGFRADPELVFHDGRLYMFHRRVNEGDDEIMLAHSDDGVAWSTPATVVTAAPTSLLSPAVLRERDGTWRMWTVNMTATPNTMQVRTATAPDGTWSSATTLDLVDPEERDLWHVDVVRDGKRYRMFMQTCGLGNSGDFGRLLLGTSADGEDWSLSTAVLSPSGGDGFDNYSVYRTSGFYEAGRWRAWYGAQKNDATWRIGYTEVPTADFP